jgi:hypothetical protein
MSNNPPLLAGTLDAQQLLAHRKIRKTGRAKKWDGEDRKAAVCEETLRESTQTFDRAADLE